MQTSFNPIYEIYTALCSYVSHIKNGCQKTWATGTATNKTQKTDGSSCDMFTYLGWKESSLTMHCFFSGTCFQVAGSARSTRALALRRPKPKRLLTIRPAPFLFQPGLLAKGSNSEVQTTMCCRSLQVRSGLRGVDRQGGKPVNVY